MASSSPLLVYTFFLGNPLRSSLYFLMFVYIFISEVKKGLWLHTHTEGKVGKQSLLTRQSGSDVAHKPQRQIVTVAGIW